MLTKNQNRRAFLKSGAVITVGTFLLPSFLKAADIGGSNGKRLIVIQLSGGNDGLNTIVPFRNDNLLRLRPTLSDNFNNIIKVSDEIGFNAGMPDFRKLFDNGDVCIINQVGYPNPNRSHFRSMDIWQSASNSNEYWETGWLGRYFDSECPPDHQVTGLEMGNLLSLAMKGRAVKGTPVTDIRQYYQATRSIHLDNDHHHDNPTASFLYKTINETRSTSEYLFEKVKAVETRAQFPDNQFGNDLKQIARLIGAGVEAPVYYASLGGFDTHNNQQRRQQRLLEMYSTGVRALIDELKAANEWSNTLILTFSEFGRRVGQNASGGTDHGKANNLFVMSGSLGKKGFYNPVSTLDSLDEGDVPFEIDFRQVYTTILDKWFGAKSKAVLGKDFDSLAFI